MLKAENVCPRNARFTPLSRLRSKKEFQQVFQGDRVANRSLVIYYRPASIAKLGIIISKKNIKCAAGRNRVKRVAREWFRLGDIDDLELIVIANRASKSMNNAEIRQCLDQLLARLRKRRVAASSN